MAAFSFIVLISMLYAGESKSTDNPRAFISLSSDQLEKAEYYTVVINKPFYLHFLNGVMANGWCEDFYDYKNLATPTISNSVIHVVNVTHSMSTLWICTLKEIMNNRLKEKSFLLYLNLHVKGAKSVNLTINGKELKTFREAVLSKPCDADTIYLYEDGDQVEVICSIPQSTGTVQLEYYMKNATNVSNSGTFCMQLHSESNNSYIDCVYNTTEPADKYVYRVTFVAHKQLLHLNKNQKLSHVNISVNQDTDTWLIVGSSIGAALIILGVTGVAYWYVRTRPAKRIEIPHGYLTNQNASQKPQKTNECEHQYDVCHYSINLSNKETQYETPESVDNMDLKANYYTKIDYTRCQPKIDKTKTRNSKVYDEPYVHITTRDTMQTLRD